MNKEFTDKYPKLSIQDLYGHKNKKLQLRLNAQRLALIEKAVVERRLNSKQEFYDKLADWFFVKVGYIDGELESFKKDIVWKGDIKDMPLNQSDFK